jgi:hypothetical protein
MAKGRGQPARGVGGRACLSGLGIAAAVAIPDGLVTAFGLRARP